MTEMTPVQFGSLIHQVDTLEKQVQELRGDVKKLLEMANKSKGGLWAGMTFASLFGGAVSWVISHVKIG